MYPTSEQSPIDRILDRRLPGLTGEQRALARERLTELAQLLIRMSIRQVREAQDRERDSREPRPGGKMDSSPPPL